MFTPHITTKTVTDNSVQIVKNVRGLSNLEVYVGIPEASAARKGKETITNAQLAFIHTHGVRTIDARRRMGAMMLNRKIDYGAAQKLFMQSKGAMAFAIPPRPIIEPAIESEDNQAAIVAELKDAAQHQLDGDQLGAIRGMKRAGQEAENRVKAWFTDPRNKWAPNAPSTIARKGSSRPLISTGALRAAIRWVLGTKG